MFSYFLSGRCSTYICCRQALSFLIGMCSVVPQILIPMAADLAPPERRASAISIVLAGLLCGVLYARVCVSFDSLSASCADGSPQDRRCRCRVRVMEDRLLHCHWRAGGRRARHVCHAP
jgi:hypothetical protein